MAGRKKVLPRGDSRTRIMDAADISHGGIRLPNRFRVAALAAICVVGSVASALAVDDGTWSLIAPSSPGPRIAPAWVHDPVRNRLVLVGNADPYQTTVDNSTYVLPLGGTTEWSRLTTTGSPPGMTGSQVTVFDQARDRMLVLNLGTSVYALTFDVPLNDPPAWSSFVPTGSYPASRQGVMGIYDAAHDRVVMFGGYSGGTAFNDVWALSLSGTPAWSPLTPAGTPPSGRWLGVAIYDPPRHRMVVFGGADASSNPMNDAWALTLDGTPTWSRIDPAGSLPPARTLSVACYDGVRERMVVFSGQPSNTLTDTWALTLSGAPAWTELATPTHPNGRELALLGWDPSHDRLVLYGGQNRTDAWQLPLNPVTDWSGIVVDPWPPAPGPYPNLVHDPVRHRLLEIHAHDLWAYPLTGAGTWTHETIGGSAPNSTGGFSTIYDPNADRVLVFGGQSGGGLSNQTWALTLSGAPAWQPLLPDGVPPDPRAFHSALYDPVRRRMIVFGGETQDFGWAVDTWELSLSGPLRWTEVPATGSYPWDSYQYSLFYDGAADRMLALRQDAQQLWSLSLSGPPVWSALAPTGTPPPRTDAALILDPVRRRLVMFGGHASTTQVKETWALRLAAPIGWSQLAPAGTAPERRMGVQGVYDPVGDRMVVRGGMRIAPSNFNYNDIGFLTWGQPVTDVQATNPSQIRGFSVHPNPASGAQIFFVRVEDASTPARLDIYSASGRRVWSRNFGVWSRGMHEVSWDGRSDRGARVAPGLYFAKLVTVGVESTRRIVRVE